MMYGRHQSGSVAFAIVHENRKGGSSSPKFFVGAGGFVERCGAFAGRRQPWRWWHRLAAAAMAAEKKLIVFDASVVSHVLTFLDRFWTVSDCVYIVLHVFRSIFSVFAGSYLL